jgi:CHAD domain-containing protein
MIYQINIHVKVNDEIIRIANELVDSAVCDCKSSELTDHEKIHSVRKTSKRLRALLKIVRPMLADTYQKENNYYRDLARTLSEERDRKVLLDSLEAQLIHPNNLSIVNDLTTLVAKLKDEDKLIDSSGIIKNFAEKIFESKERIKEWKINGDGFDAVKGGIERTYRRGRIAMRNAYRNATSENYHEWRKRVKSHYYHLELVSQIWPVVMESFVNEVHNLSELLGRDHDLCIMEEKMLLNTELIKNEDVKNIIFEAIKIDKQNLRKEIKVLGSRIYNEGANQLVTRFAGYWNSTKLNNYN